VVVGPLLAVLTALPHRTPAPDDAEAAVPRA
jgi:hypothetical protein